MEIIACGKGHYYNPELYSSCPECAKLSSNPVGLQDFSGPVDCGRRPETWSISLDARDSSTWKERLNILKNCSSIQKVSSGSTCDVYRVEKGGTCYALKVMDCGNDQNRLRRARYEIFLMEKLRDCRGVVHLADSEVLHSGETAIAFLLEEYVPSFEDYYKSNNITVADVINLGIHISRALAACWEAGVAHLDVQPRNIFADSVHGFLLGDFGSSLTTDLLAQETQLRGTVAYTAPEVYHKHQYSQASEIYSLGMVLYTLLNHGSLPFTERMSKPAAIDHRLTGALLPPLPQYGVLWEVICRACRYQPDARYVSFRELENALKNLLVSIPDALLSISVHTAPQQKVCAAPAPAAPRKAAKPGLFGALKTILQKDAPAPVTKPDPPCMPQQVIRDDTGNLFDENAVKCDIPAFWDSEPTKPSFDTDFCASTAPIGAFDVITAPISFGDFEPSTASAGSDIFSPGMFAPVGSTCVSDLWSHNTAVPGNLFDSDSFAHSCSIAPSYAAPMESCAPIAQDYAPAPMPAPAACPPPRMDQVQFSAVAPRETRKGDYSIIQIFMYEQAFRNVVEEAIAMAESAAQEKRSGFHKVREDTRVKIVLTCPDMVIDDNVQEQIWCGGYLQFDFAICPPEDFKKQQILLTAAVYFDDIPATRLMLIMKSLASYEEEIELARKDIITAFVSYSSQDRTRVAALIQGMRKARPDMDIFFDVTTLRSGDDWEKTMYREILQRDILFLCWSRNAQVSPWVDKEWRYALDHKGLDSIEPIPLEQPDVCPPPKELWNKHFNDTLLYIINR